MKTITEIKQQQKNNKRVSIYLNGSYYCGLDLLTVMKNRLKVGLEIDENKLVEIQRESEFSACFESGLKIVSKMLKTEKEVYLKLTKKGYLDEIVKEVIEKLKSYNYLNDKDYSERYLSTYKGKKGKKLIALELKQKGVSDSDVSIVTESNESELETCIEIAKKYVKNKDKDVKTLQKCYKYLLSKGFSYEDSLTASKKAVSIDEN